MRWISATYIGGLLVLLGVALLHAITGQPIYKYTRDPAALAGLSPSTGFLSNFGIVLWMATAAICLLTSAVLPSRRARGFFLCTAALSAALGMDDLLQLHEVYYPRLGIPEQVIYGVYVLSVGAWLAAYRSIIRGTRFVSLGVALAAFAFGMAADQLHDSQAPWHHLYEDGAKWIGIVGWSAYFGHTCYTWLSRATQREKQSEHTPPLVVSDR